MEIEYLRDRLLNDPKLKETVLKADTLDKTRMKFLEFISKPYKNSFVTSLKKRLRNKAMCSMKPLSHN